MNDLVNDCRCPTSVWCLSVPTSTLSSTRLCYKSYWVGSQRREVQWWCLRSSLIWWRMDSVILLITAQSVHLTMMSSTGHCHSPGSKVTWQDSSSLLCRVALSFLYRELLGPQTMCVCEIHHMTLSVMTAAESASLDAGRTVCKA